MELADAFLVHTLFLLTPGIVACRIATSLRGFTYDRAWDALVDSLAFSVLGYVVAAVATLRPPTSALGAFLDTDAHIDWGFIGFASCASSIAAGLKVAADSRNSLHRFAKWLRLTNRVSNEDVWSFFLQETKADWHFVRDHSRGQLLYGHIHAYSDSEKGRELWLKTVRVYDETADPPTPLYEAEDLYWAGQPEDATLETPSEKVNVQVS